MDFKGLFDSIRTSDLSDSPKTFAENVRRKHSPKTKASRDETVGIQQGSETDSDGSHNKLLTAVALESDSTSNLAAGFDILVDEALVGSVHEVAHRDWKREPLVTPC